MVQKRFPLEAIAPDGKLDLQTGQVRHNLIGHTRSMMTVAITPDGKRIVSGSQSSRITIWDLETGEKLRILDGHTLFVNAIAITPDGKHAIA